VRNIGLIGLAGSGKDTAAKVLCDLGYKRVAFASKLKMIAFCIGWDGYKNERGRALLQDIGMAGRRYNPYCWINDIDSLLEPGETGLVFTDVRFQNEADYIRSKDGIIVRIVRPGQIAENHESELKQSEVAADIEIVNDGSIEDLHNKIKQLIK
jgi:ABC-type oligopeptide transport system ATPase subunit